MDSQNSLDIQVCIRISKYSDTTPLLRSLCVPKFVVGCMIELCNELVMLGSVVILVATPVIVLVEKTVSLIFSVSLSESMIL